MPSSIDRSGRPLKRNVASGVTSPVQSVHWLRVTGLTKIVRPVSQQYIIQSSAPNSNVAATIPKTNAPRKIALLFSSLMTNKVRSLGVSLLAGIGAAALIGCSETTAPVRRYPVLDDVGESQWATVSVGTDHTCGLRVNGAAFCWGSNRSYQLGVAHVDTSCGGSPRRTTARSRRRRCSRE